jgi:ubiquinone/menaquinone biosynthesis C-methylase UbiE
MKQKDIFLKTEGNAWFDRNLSALQSRCLPGDDPLLMELLAIIPPTKALDILEIGCGEGARLSWLQKNLNAECYGIDPSNTAVTALRAKGIQAIQGTADFLPYKQNFFDIVIFGFCLYLCDREDLFRIASEADRVLRKPGWLVIVDFFNPNPKVNSYHHHPGVLSHKMDYRTLFDWHPDYECLTHKVRNHGDLSYSDDLDEWVAVSVLRKFSPPTDI